jgi:ABC-type multidrug transport system fused ATPase/permease subunit
MGAPTSNGIVEPTASSTALLGRFEAQFLRKYRGAIALGLVAVIVQSLLLLPVPLLQGWVLDRLVTAVRSELPIQRPSGARESSQKAHPFGDRLARPGPPAGAFRAAIVQAIVLALAVTITLHLARAVVAWKVAAMMGRISQEVVVELRGTLHQKLMRLPMAYFDAQQTGRLMARVTSDVGSILMFIRSGILQLLNDLILSVAIAVLLGWLSWRLALVALVTVPLYALNQRFFYSILRRLSDEIRSQVSSLYALLSERVSAVRVVRSFAKEDDELVELDERIDRHRELSWANTRAAAVLGGLATLISGLGTVFVIAYGIILVGRGSLTVGELLAIYALVGQLYQPIVRLTQFQATALSAHVAVERLYEIFDEPEPIRDRPHAASIIHPRGAIEYRDVSFAYSPDGPKVLSGIRLRLEPGMRLGVLGESGAGKSTLAALAPRLYDLPDGTDESGHSWGAIFFDGRDVRDLKLADLRRAVALVPQQALLFEGTIRTNLVYANPGATEAQMEEALTIADLADTVAALPDRLDTPVGERGYSLSGGQRQRLALARAIVAEPTVLLLDDCTSALDAETEARIQLAFDHLLPGRTCLIVSHKVAAVWNADLIVVLESGRIIEQGTHSTLLTSGGYYAATHHQQTTALMPTGFTTVTPNTPHP